MPVERRLGGFPLACGLQDVGGSLDARAERLASGVGREHAHARVVADPAHLGGPLLCRGDEAAVVEQGEPDGRRHGGPVSSERHEHRVLVPAQP
jgi:hypothetical protein